MKSQLSVDKPMEKMLSHFQEGQEIDKRPEKIDENKLSVSVVSVTFQNEENGWTVLRCLDLSQNKDVIVVGEFLEVFPHECFILYGSWIHHNKFGKQFKADRAVPLRPSSLIGMQRYLSSGLYPGIGEKTAERIVDFFGHDTFFKLDHHPELVKDIPKIGKKKAAEIVAVWQEKREKADLYMFLSQHGIGQALGRKIINYYRSDIKLIQSVITKMPYQLIQDIKGVGFLIADKIALSVGIEKHDPRRIEEGVIFALNQAEDKGHCFLYLNQLKEELQKILALDMNEYESDLFSSIERLNRNMRMVSTGDFSHTAIQVGGMRHYLYELFEAEEAVAQAIKNLLNESYFDEEGLDQQVHQHRIHQWLERYCEKSSIKLTTKQWNGATAAVTSKVFILTGGPGVGKTTTANTIIRLFHAMNRSTSLCAPTGRAAQRLTELTGQPAKTIHRLLEWSAQEGRFLKDASNPLTTSVVIVDESSMLDIRLARALFEAVPKTAQLILIGDVDQLPSVGPGNVLKNLIDSELVPMVQLTEIFRQAKTSRIIQAAHDINHGLMPQTENSFQSDCQFFSCEESEDILPMLRELIVHHLGKMGCDMKRDLQILTPMNRGDLGSVNLNIILQELINPAAIDLPQMVYKGSCFRTKDKVIQMVNNYDHQVFNGDIGYIISLSEIDKQMSVDFSGRVVTYKQDEIDELQLAYAITIHKSQGSEFAIVIIPLSTGHFIMLQRNLIYTALTRAKKLAIFIGQEKALSIATKNVSGTKRQTYLTESLRQII